MALPMTAKGLPAAVEIRAMELRSDLLAVDSELEIAEPVTVYLRGEGFQVTSCGTGAEALEILGRERFDLAMLDVILPDISGMALCAEIRRSQSFPVLMRTEKTRDRDQITDPAVGADDYMIKLLSPQELAARVRRS